MARWLTPSVDDIFCCICVSFGSLLFLLQHINIPCSFFFLISSTSFSPSKSWHVSTDRSEILVSLEIGKRSGTEAEMREENYKWTRGNFHCWKRTRIAKKIRVQVDMKSNWVFHHAHECARAQTTTIPIINSGWTLYLQMYTQLPLSPHCERVDCLLCTPRTCPLSFEGFGDIYLKEASRRD